MAQDKIVAVTKERKDAERVVKAIGQAYNWSTLQPYIDMVPDLGGAAFAACAVKVSCSVRMHNELMGFAKGILYTEVV